MNIIGCQKKAAPLAPLRVVVGKNGIAKKKLQKVKK